MSTTFIAIEGNIGAGKTTLAKKVAEWLNAELVLEKFVENPYLEKFYQQPERYALQTELWFLQERIKQLSDLSVTHEYIVSDYSIFRSLIFAQKTLTQSDYQLYKTYFDKMSISIQNPDIMVFLRASVPTLMGHIKKRARKFEAGLKPSYLQGINDSYTRFINTFKLSHVINIDADRFDFIGNSDDLKKVQNILFQNIKNTKK